MTRGITQQDGIKYGKYLTGKLAVSEDNGHTTIRTSRGPVQIMSREEAELKKRVTTENAWAVHNGTAYLAIPIPPMKLLDETDGTALQARTRHAELFLERNAQWLEKHFGLEKVQGVIDHEDGGTITLQLDAKQYQEKVAPLAHARVSVSR